MSKVKTMSQMVQPKDKGPNFLDKRVWLGFLVSTRERLATAGKFSDEQIDRIINRITATKDVADDGDGHIDLRIVMNEITGLIRTIREENTEPSVTEVIH